MSMGISFVYQCMLFKDLIQSKLKVFQFFKLSIRKLICFNDYIDLVTAQKTSKFSYLAHINVSSKPSSNQILIAFNKADIAKTMLSSFLEWQILMI